MSALLALFVGSFLAATILPGGSELLLYSLAGSNAYPLTALLAVASVGNTLGGCLSLAMGRLLVRGISHCRRCPRWLVWVTGRCQLEQAALRRLQHYGPAALLLAWLPIVGDPLCIAAGFLRLPLGRCVLAIAVGKVLRYGVVLLLLPLF